MSVARRSSLAEAFGDPLSRIAALSIAVAVAVMAIKYLAYLRTGSVALYSDALESVVNLATAVVALVAIRISRQPPDRNHPFGHHKVEYFSAVFEGVLVVIAALLILQEAWEALQTPRTIQAPLEGIAINTLATAVNGAWAWFLIDRGRCHKSPALIADGRHLVTDVITSIGVVAGLGLAMATGWTALDPLIAGAVAVHILLVGWRLASESVSGLMDHAADAATVGIIRRTISAEAEGAIEVHDLRTRVAAAKTFIEFHLVVPASMSVGAAHAICDRLEAALRREIAGADILIHVEPEGEARHSGVLVL